MYAVCPKASTMYVTVMHISFVFFRPGRVCSNTPKKFRPPTTPIRLQTFRAPLYSPQPPKRFRQLSTPIHPPTPRSPITHKAFTPQPPKIFRQPNTPIHPPTSRTRVSHQVFTPASVLKLKGIDPKVAGLMNDNRE
jgi:hypothetical protein